jgi:hypothetical protein
MGSLQILGAGIPDDGNKAKAQTAIGNLSALRGVPLFLSSIALRRRFKAGHGA